MASFQRANGRVMPLGYPCVQNTIVVMRFLRLSHVVGDVSVIWGCDAATVPQCQAPATFAVSVIVKLKPLTYLLPVKHHSAHIVKYSVCFKLEFKTLIKYRHASVYVPLLER
jgi:hypothetical protein